MGKRYKSTCYMQSSISTLRPPPPQQNTMWIFRIWLCASTSQKLNMQNTGCSSLITSTVYLTWLTYDIIWIKAAILTTQIYLKFIREQWHAIVLESWCFHDNYIFTDKFFQIWNCLVLSIINLYNISISEVGSGTLILITKLLKVIAELVAILCKFVT